MWSHTHHELWFNTWKFIFLSCLVCSCLHAVIRQSSCFHLVAELTQDVAATVTEEREGKPGDPTSSVLQLRSDCYHLQSIAYNSHMILANGPWLEISRSTWEYGEHKVAMLFWLPNILSPSLCPSQDALKLSSPQGSNVKAYAIISPIQTPSDPDPSMQTQISAPTSYTV